MRFIGIDPGITGALAVLDDESGYMVIVDTPTLQIESGKKIKNIQDATAITRLLGKVTSAGKALVTIEKVNAMPGHGKNGEVRSMGATSAFNFGFGFGMWMGILAALEIPHQQVHPMTWKKLVMADMDKEKDASRIKAMQLYPQASVYLERKKDHGRADALLLAEWARRTYKSS